MPELNVAMPDKLMTIKEVAVELKVSDSTIRRAIRAKQLDVHRIGSAKNQIRISRAQLDSYIGCNRAPVVEIEDHLDTAIDSSSEVDRSPIDAHPLRAPVTIRREQTSEGLEWQVITADAKAGLKSLPDASVNCIVTSPPYFWQRDYEVEGQIGHEREIDAYMHVLQGVFREALRVLRDDGVLFLNIGDTYYSAKGKPHGRDQKHRARQLSRTALRAVDGPGLGLPRKSLIGLPWRVALALQTDGWVLRSSIIWQRPAPMPEPTAKDRPWRTHEPVFLFSKRPRYWFNRTALGAEEDIWRISTHAANPGAHFAPYPLEFAERCVQAGCPVGGTVLDPFVGSGTTMLASLIHGMSAIGIDLKTSYTHYTAERILKAFPVATKEVSGSAAAPGQQALRA